MTFIPRDMSHLSLELHLTTIILLTGDDTRWYITGATKSPLTPTTLLTLKYLNDVNCN